MLTGSVTLGDHKIAFTQTADENVRVCVVDLPTQKIEEYYADPAEFFNALAIAVSLDGTGTDEQWEQAERLFADTNRIRFIP